MGNVSVKLIMRSSKRRPDGTAPIYLRAIHARRSREAATGVWVEPKDWNAAKQEVRKSHPLYKSYNAKLEDQLLKKSQAAVWSALNEPERSYTELRVSIVALCSDYELEGPFYRVKRKGRK